MGFPVLLEKSSTKGELLKAKKKTQNRDRHDLRDHLWQRRIRPPKDISVFFSSPSAAKVLFCAEQYDMSDPNERLPAGIVPNVEASGLI
ncbi:hypothetical protein NPIL_340051 [Nephila pilipes]|uniref:Uncharacterized protein n=1 Tax=Nephila pilipes TaxID=299642 RepID=A0A8X6QGD3_NEPPI|nr:hypothetical protein NPIL_340051 [Nephila pilipes]